MEMYVRNHPLQPSPIAICGHVNSSPSLRDLEKSLFGRHGFLIKGNKRVLYILDN